MQVVVFGAGGYSGLELARWLAWHPEARLVAASSDQHEGRPVSDLVPGLRGPLEFTSHVATLAGTRPGQIACLATPARTAAELAPTLLARGLRVIDLSGGHRLPAEQYPAWYGFEHPHPRSLEEAVYGCPELVDPATIAAARIVANPGCYATAAALAAAPLIEADLLEPSAPLVIDGKSGTTGAGRTQNPALAFSETAEDVRPYRVGGHQHTPEIERTLSALTDRAVRVAFTAHLVPMRRGLLCSVYGMARPGVTPERIDAAFRARFDGCPLVRVRTEAPPETKRVYAGPSAEVHATLDPRTGTVMAFGAIDNLVKGAAGQAVQNLNLMIGAPVTSGLLAEVQPPVDPTRAQSS